MSSILIKNANIITIDPKRPKIEQNMSILIVDNKIAKIDKTIKPLAKTEIIDGTNKYVIPGMINGHTHIPMSFSRETIDGCKLQDWLYNHILPRESKIEGDEWYWFSLLSDIECLRNGVTTVNDLYFECKHIVKAAKETGINRIYSVTLTDIDGKEHGQRRINNTIKFFQDFPNEIKTIGIHGLYTCSKEYCIECAKMAKKLKCNLIHMHFCENTDEVKTIKKMHKVTHPTDCLVNYFKGFNLILAHCVKLDEQDFKCIKNIKASIITNPLSNARLGCGFADIPKMRKCGINVALGTDGQGSGSNLSILQSARQVSWNCKCLYEDPTIITAYETLKMATINGAKAVHLEKTKGSLEVGKDADIVIFNFKSIEMFPVNEVIDDIVYNSTANDIETVIANGKIVVKNSKHVSVNEKLIINKCTKLIEDIKKR
ncbi:MAG: multifunctional 5'-deoxyadenosine/S-adenosyl-L-homocysteine/5'-methylthioad enosine deaminase [Mycoplasmoidaceae bacterium]|nr:MAG: multifunctional 5'-deoxyadenosine/S-adenosyl-L-homocysteine/5'-methylthioad enosine deaminase [Mycoplasmoidaceae bacterium]